MPYHHSTKAGNPGDVVKHALVAEIVSRMARPDLPFVYAETHAGSALHLLAPGGEWEEGLGVVDPSPEPGAWERLVLGPSLLPSAEREGWRPYPGSALLAWSVLKDRGAKPHLLLCELNPAVCADLQAGFQELGVDAASILPGDGYRTLRGLLEESPRPSLVLLDPPAFEAVAIEDALERCHDAGVPAVAWLPMVAEPGELPPEVPGLERWAADTRRPTLRATWPRPSRADRCARGCVLVGSDLPELAWKAGVNAVRKLNVPAPWRFEVGWGA
jgi:23S rRNA (adenine2030-N6)-methyltransferase